GSLCSDRNVASGDLLPPAECRVRPVIGDELRRAAGPIPGPCGEGSSLPPGLVLGWRLPGSGRGLGGLGAPRGTGGEGTENFGADMKPPKDLEVYVPASVAASGLINRGLDLLEKGFADPQLMVRWSLTVSQWSDDWLNPSDDRVAVMTKGTVSSVNGKDW